MTDVVKMCDVIDNCTDCPRYADDCDGDKHLDRYPTMHEYAEGKRINPKLTDLIRREYAIEAVHRYFVGEFNNEPYETDEDGDEVFTDMKSVNKLLAHNKAVSRAIKALPSAEAEPMAEEVREALMRLSMCAREECVICKYKDKCNFDFQYEESTKNMNTILDSLMRSKCEVDAKWIPCSERLPSEDECGWYLVTVKGHELFVDIAPFNDTLWKGLASHQKVIAWMPLPKPYEAESEVEE